MPMYDKDLRKDVTKALSDLVAGTKSDLRQLFDRREASPLDGLSAPAAYAQGVIEGAAVALGMTPLELLDELDLSARPAATV